MILLSQPLSIVWNFDPVLFSIGSLDIRYYGLMWALAILIGAKFFDNFVRREGLPAKVSESIFIYGTLATILGARLGHCLFYDTMEYLSKPWTIITGFRDGGMASHGAAIGLLIGLWLFSRRNRLPYIWSLDRIMIPVGIGCLLYTSPSPRRFTRRSAIWRLSASSAGSITRRTPRAAVRASCSESA